MVEGLKNFNPLTKGFLATCFTYALNALGAATVFEMGEGMTVRVDADLCTACELCTERCLDIFEIGEDMATVKVDVVPSGSEECVRQAAEDCLAEPIIIEG